jgi:hypothetical protein
MIVKAYLRVATALVNSAVFVMAGGAYSEPTTIVLESEAQQDDERQKSESCGRLLRIKAVKEQIRRAAAKLMTVLGSFQQEKPPMSSNTRLPVITDERCADKLFKERK